MERQARRAARRRRSRHPAPLRAGDEIPRLWPFGGARPEMHRLPGHAPPANLQRRAFRPEDHRVRILPAPALFQSGKRSQNGEGQRFPPPPCQAQSRFAAGLVLSPRLWRNRRSLPRLHQLQYDFLTPRYELHTGRQIGDILNREGSFRLAFPEDLNGVIRLNGQWDEEEIDSWGAELPMVVLDTLQRDLDLARAESTHSTHAAAAETPSEHPAAS